VERNRERFLILAGVKQAIDSREPAGKSLPVPTLLAEVASHPFLRELSSDHLGKLANNAMKVRFQAGETIFREGDPANRFYLLKDGKVALESSSETGCTLIQKIGAGDVLGWSWLFPPYYWHFDARALEATEAIFFYGTRLRELCEEDHDFGYELMLRTSDILIQRLTAARKQLVKGQLKTCQY
jgi:CRP/FNR family cyclic AMP-dependent transcriptional regulator